MAVNPNSRVNSVLQTDNKYKLKKINRAKRGVGGLKICVETFPTSGL